MKNIGKAKRDAPLSGAGAALERAAKRARELAARTGTPLVIYEDGRVVHKKIAKGKTE